MRLTFTVIGTPAPQGSKRFVGVSKRTGRGIMIESSKKTRPWRIAVQQAALELGLRISGPVSAMLTFTLPKPKSAPKRRTTWPDRKPDIDKLLRSTFDGMVEAGTIEDDARIVRLTSAKVFPNEGEDALAVPGCVVRIESIEQ